MRSAPWFPRLGAAILAISMHPGRHGAAFLEYMRMMADNAGFNDPAFIAAVGEAGCGQPPGQHRSQGIEQRDRAVPSADSDRGGHHVQISSVSAYVDPAAEGATEADAESRLSQAGAASAGAPAGVPGSSADTAPERADGCRQGEKRQGWCGPQPKARTRATPEGEANP